MRSDMSKESSSHGAGPVNAGLIQVIKDFSHYLVLQKQTGYPFPGISEDSCALINKWGTRTLPKAAFFFEGPENADVFIIDSEGSFFQGKSGELLKKILAAMALSCDAVFICNAEDMNAVLQKIKTISPKIIITLGDRAGQALLGEKQPLEHFRGRFFDHQGIRVMPTFHPSLLLTQPQFKRQVWEDMKQVMASSGLKDGS